MKTEQLLELLKTNPQSVEFQQVMETVDQNYDYTPTRFRNGDVVNESGTNEGSCKIFAFGQFNQLKEDETLACFGTYYRDDVLQNPQGTDHANIRTFMVNGWRGIKFDNPALVEKST